MTHQLEPHTHLVAYGYLGDNPAHVDVMDYSGLPAGLDPIAAFTDKGVARDCSNIINKGLVDGRRTGVFRVPLLTTPPQVEFVYHRVVTIAQNDLIRHVDERQELYIPDLRLAMPAARVWPSFTDDPTRVDVHVEERPQPNQWRWRITATGRNLPAVRAATEQEENNCKVIYTEEQRAQ